MLTLPEVAGILEGVESFLVGVTSLLWGVGVRLGVEGWNIPMSLGVSLRRGDNRCLAASFRAAGDMLARRSVLVLKLKEILVRL